MTDVSDPIGANPSNAASQPTSALTQLDDARQTFRKLAVTALETVTALHDGLNHPNNEPSSNHRARLNRSLRDLARTREGFICALRVPEVAMTTELRSLVGLLMDWSWLEGLGLRWVTDEQPLERVTDQTLLYQHAMVALGMIPLLPPNAVTHPRRTYSDVPVPDSPGAMLSRLEELERVIWAAANEPVNALPPEAMRRTYGFFEATTWLIAHHMANIIGI